LISEDSDRHLRAEKMSLSSNLAPRVRSAALSQSLKSSLRARPLSNHFSRARLAKKEISLLCRQQLKCPTKTSKTTRSL